MARKKEADDPRTPAEKRQAILGAFAATCNIVRACKKAKVSRATHYRWLKENAGYAAVFEESRLAAGDLLESIAADRASKGWLEPVYYHGKVCGHVRRYSDGLLMCLLRGLKPDVYGVQRQEISGPQATPMQGKIEVIVVKPDGSRKPL
jgi:hypothetical protein